MKKIIGKLHLLRDKIRRVIGVFLFDEVNLVDDIKDIKHILIVRWDAKLGDSYISSFFFREIKKLANVHVSVITTPELKNLYFDGFHVDSVLTMSKRPTYKELKLIANKLDSVDLVVHFTEYMKMKDLYFLSQLDAPYVASLDDDIKRVNIKLSKQTRNMLFHDKYVYLLNLLSIPDIDRTYIIPYSKNNEINDCDILINFFGSTDHKSICNERAVIILVKIAELYPSFKIGVLSSPSTKNKAKLIVKDVDRKNVFLLENIYSINDAVNAVANAKIIISVDTSIVHVSTGLKKPTLAIYPEKKDCFNPWLPPESESTVIIYSLYSGVNVDVNNFSDEKLLEKISLWNSKFMSIV